MESRQGQSTPAEHEVQKDGTQFGGQGGVRRPGGPLVGRRPEIGIQQ
jgi:hypothetical protein